VKKVNKNRRLYFPINNTCVRPCESPDETTSSFYWCDQPQCFGSIVTEMNSSTISLSMPVYVLCTSGTAAVVSRLFSRFSGPPGLGAVPLPVHFGTVPGSLRAPFKQVTIHPVKTYNREIRDRRINDDTDRPIVELRALRFVLVWWMYPLPIIIRTVMTYARHAYYYYRRENSLETHFSVVLRFRCFPKPTRIRHFCLFVYLATILDGKHILLSLLTCFPFLLYSNLFREDNFSEQFAQKMYSRVRKKIPFTPHTYTYIVDKLLILSETISFITDLSIRSFVGVY